MDELLTNRSDYFNTTNVAANTTVRPILNSSTELDTFKTIFQTLLAFFGVIGNLAVCFVITRNKKMKSSTEFLIRNLAIADIGVLTLHFTLSVIKEKLPYHWPLGKFCCLYLAPSTDVFYGVSVWSIVAIAVERYRHLVCNLRKDRNQTVKLVKKLIILLWISSFLLFTAPFLHYMRFIESGSKVICYFNPPSPEAMEIIQIFLLLALYCIPVLSIIWSYVLISRKLDKSSVFLRRMHASDSSITYTNKNHLSLMQERRLSQNRRVKRVLTPLVVAFVVLMMPNNIGRMYILYNNSIVHKKIYPVLIYIISLCNITNSSINPLIYSFVSPGFRAGVWALLKNRSFRTPLISAGNNFGALNGRLPFWLKPRKKYKINLKERINMQSLRNSVQTTPVASVNE